MALKWIIIHHFKGHQLLPRITFILFLFILSFLLHKVLIKVTKLSGHLAYFLVFHVRVVLKEQWLCVIVNTGEIENDS